MHEPHFWRVRDLRSRASAPTLRLVLSPLSALYAAIGQKRIAAVRPVSVGVPVVCVGNLTLGGAGKTPVAAALRDMAAARGVRAASLSRGYQARERGPLRVDPSRHTAADVGDEPLLLAGSGEAWIARNRALGALAMEADGVGIVIMDDGHQNPTLARDLSIVVIDATDPFGNGFVFPKGPLREPPAQGLARADAVVLMGEGELPAQARAFAGPVLRARLAPIAPPEPGRYVAFAGIARPFRFFDALRGHDGIVLAEATAFPDHHAYSAADIRDLAALARTHSARLITTEKDHVRLPAAFREIVASIPVRARFADETALAALLDRLFEQRPS
jgi:tetraacyldisaccharide 4'-kinase